jgi:hypothetical protein
MIIAIVALLSLVLACAVVLIIQLGVLAFHNGDLKAYTRTQISLLQEINDKLTPSADGTPANSSTATIGDEQTFHNTVMALNDLRRTTKENPRYTSCRSVAQAWINAAYERLQQ